MANLGAHFLQIWGWEWSELFSLSCMHVQEVVLNFVVLFGLRGSTKIVSGRPLDLTQSEIVTEAAVVDRLIDRD